MTAKIFLKISLVCSLACLFSSLAKADFFLHTWDNHYVEKSYTRAKLIGSYYQSTANLSASGTKIIPYGFQNYTRYRGDFFVDWGFAQRFSLFGRLSWGYITVNSAALTGKVFGFTDQSIGLSLRAYQQSLGSAYSEHPSFTFDIQAQFDFPAYTQASANQAQVPYLGDQSMDSSVGAFMSIPLFYKDSYTFSLSGGAAYTYRNLGFSAAMPWTADIQYKRNTKGLIASIGMAGLLSLRTDQTINSANPRSSIGTGGSVITGAMNPSFYAARGTLGYLYKNKMEITASLMQTLGGTSAPYSTDIILGFLFYIGTPGSSHPAHIEPETYGKANQGFLRYSLDAKVVRTNDRLNLVKIDKGSQDGIAVGEIFDIFSVKKNGEVGVALSRARVVGVQEGETALEIQEYFNDAWIEEGFVAKKLIQ